MVKIIGPERNNIPWQDRSQDAFLPLWRYRKKTVISRHLLSAVQKNAL